MRGRTVPPSPEEPVSEDGKEGRRSQKQQSASGFAHTLEDDNADGGSEDDPQGRVNDGADHGEDQEPAIADLSRSGENGREETDTRGESAHQYGHPAVPAEEGQRLLHTAHGSEGEPAIEGEEPGPAAHAQRVEDVV